MSTSDERDFSGLDTLGDRLADWLDGLGLLGHLAEAGLPTLQRNSSGKAVWRDPATGADLTREQLLELDTLLHQEGDEPAHAVPVALLQLAQRARVRQELLETPTHTYESLAAVRGTSVDATRFWIHKSAERHELLVVNTHQDDQERALVPAFQLDDEGAVRPELADVLAVLAASPLDAWAVWGWLARPAALLGGDVPERLASDPEELAVVQHAARRLAARTS